MRQNPTWLGLNKIEVYFWLLSKSRGRFFRIAIGLELSGPFNLVAPLRNSNFHSQGCLMIQSCQSSSYHNQFHPTGREKGGNRTHSNQGYFLEFAHPKLPLISYWPALSHRTIPINTGDWEMYAISGGHGPHQKSGVLLLQNKGRVDTDG